MSRGITKRSCMMFTRPQRSWSEDDIAMLAAIVEATTAVVEPEAAALESSKAYAVLSSGICLGIEAIRVSFLATTVVSFLPIIADSNNSVVRRLTSRISFVYI